MPRRKRTRSGSPARPSTSPTPAAPAAPAAPADDSIARFASALRASEERARADAERAQGERARAEALEVARVELDRAIEDVRSARRSGRGTADADLAWRAAKSRVIELETGAPPEWARDPGASNGEHGERDGHGADGEHDDGTSEADGAD